jgi:hypothetical protein
VWKWIDAHRDNNKREGAIIWTLEIPWNIWIRPLTQISFRQWWFLVRDGSFYVCRCDFKKPLVLKKSRRIQFQIYFRSSAWKAFVKIATKRREMWQLKTWPAKSSRPHTRSTYCYILKKKILSASGRGCAAHFFMMKISIGSNRLAGGARAAGFLRGKVRGNLLFILQNLNSIADAGERMAREGRWTHHRHKSELRCLKNMENVKREWRGGESEAPHPLD